MTPLSRRFFVGATAAAGAAATVGLPGVTGTAAAAAPATGTAGAAATGTSADVKHVVILMQENRSFDHYFGP